MKTISEADLKELTYAKTILENPGLAAKITDIIGKPIESGLEKLPEKWKTEIGQITNVSLLKAVDFAFNSMRDTTPEKASNKLHKLAVAATGAVGGAFGLAGLPIELPVSTIIMFRSILDIAREHGEPINKPDTKLACLEVFSLGGPSNSDDAVNSGYFAIRAILAKSVTEASEFIIGKKVIEKGAPIIIKLITQIAERYSIQIGEKTMLQSIPLVGAIGGGLINTIFMDHFQDMANGHFIVRKLERKYGSKVIEKEYTNLDI